MPRNLSRFRMALLICVLVCLAVVVVGRFILPHFIINYVRERSVRIVRERFHADVRFGEFDITLLFPRLFITGRDVTLTKANAQQPLIYVSSFQVEAGLMQFLRSPAHVTQIQLHGMSIHVPPRTGEKKPEPPRPPRQHYPVVMDTLLCEDCELNISPKNPQKDPLHFAIHRLTMENLGLGRSAPYQASLTNAVPRGEIETSGSFGPWEPDSPSTTPLAGNYEFTHANLDPFPGIAGTLDSTGQFGGILERIIADGETNTPDFSLDTADHPVHLKTQFHAIIDGTSGDTELDPVKAQLANSSILARGKVAGIPGKKGKAVILDVTVSPGRLEDLLRLGVKSPRPPMLGSVRFHTHLEVPPGTETVSKRLKLDGHFVALGAEPTNPKLQKKLENLSRRAVGRPKDLSAGSDKFDLQGRFILDRGVARLPDVTFSVPGAKLNLAGDYALHSEKLSFAGELRLHAKLSQTTTGIKSFFLKAIDPFFKGTHAGAVLPIKITGTRAHPSFGLSLGKSGDHKGDYEAERRP